MKSSENKHFYLTKILIVLSILLWHSKLVESNPTASFMISFQTSGKETTDEWAEYKGTMPSLNEFSVCHWF